jgi:hypothetical protein
MMEREKIDPRGIMLDLDKVSISPREREKHWGLLEFIYRGEK